MKRNSECVITLVVAMPDSKDSRALRFAVAVAGAVVDKVQQQSKG